MIIDALMGALNATPHYRFRRTWGVLQPQTQRYNGMIGDVQTGESVIAGSTVFLTVPRVAQFEYIAEINPTRIEFLLRAPPLTLVTNIYSLPFEADVWLCGSAICGLACAVIYATLWWMDALQLHRDRDRVRASDVLLLGVGAVAQMGTTMVARRLSTKMAIVWLDVWYSS